MIRPGYRRWLRLCVLAWTFVGISVALAQTEGQDGAEKPQGSKYFIFIDRELIWTLEMVEGVPVVNIVTLIEGEWPLRPQQWRIMNAAGRRARVEKFSMETGERPYITPYFKVLGNSFIGIDLEGNFGNFEEPTEVTVDLGEFRYYLQAMEPLAFENLVQKINNINFDSPDIREDYEVLKIDLIGKRRMRPRR